MSKNLIVNVCDTCGAEFKHGSRADGMKCGVALGDKPPHTFCEGIVKPPTPRIRFRTMERIIADLKPSKTVLQRWLQMRGIFCHEDDAQKIAETSLPTIQTEHILRDLIHKEAFAARQCEEVRNACEGLADMIEHGKR